MSDFEFASKDLTAGQLNAIVKKLGGEDVVRGILADRMKFAITEKELLAQCEQVSVGPIVPGNAQKFFTTREDLYVWDGFVDRVLSTVKGEAGLSERIILQSYTLTEPANDATIRNSLSKNHVFEATELCAILQHLIGGQPNGKEGHLLSNGYANLFYVKGGNDQLYVVLVDWDAGYRGWSVRAWSLDGDGWHAGNRVFSRLSAE